MGDTTGLEARGSAYWEGGRACREVGRGRAPGREAELPQGPQGKLQALWARAPVQQSGPRSEGSGEGHPLASQHHCRVVRLPPG